MLLYLCDCGAYQLAATMLDGNHMFINLLDRFQLMEWALAKSPSLGGSRTAAEPLVGMMEDFMAIMLNVVEYAPVPLQCHRSDGAKEHDVREIVRSCTICCVLCFSRYRKRALPHRALYVSGVVLQQGASAAGDHPQSDGVSETPQ